MAVPRHLFLRQARKHLNLPSTSRHVLQSNNDEAPEQPGEMHVYAFYAPALDADEKYSIISNQNAEITLPDGDPSAQPAKPATVLTPVIQNEQPQAFSIAAPEFRLEYGDVHSTYPPGGHADCPQTLPHVVLSDPHLPWERGRRNSKGMPDESRNRIPWMALFVFEGDTELKLSPEHLGSGGIFPKDMTATAPVAQDKTSYAVEMTWDQLTRLDPSIPVQVSKQRPPDDKDTKMSIIFPPVDIFKQLFATPGNESTASIDKYKYLAHYRNVNTSGMADSGTLDTGLFSIVISGRTGPTNLVGPKTVVAHLVSIDGIPEAFPVRAGATVGSLISLYSWTYRCLPPSSINFKDIMQKISRQSAQMLKATIYDKAPVSQSLRDRLDAGYALVRHRVETGEETVAFMRGPLTPIPPPEQKFTGENWPAQSNFGSDYQLLDPVTGIRDISYDSAWQLGRTVAISDKKFSSTLTRFRSSTLAQAWGHQKKTILARAGLWRTKAEILMSLKGHVERMQDLHQAHLKQSGGDHEASIPKRWIQARPEMPDLSRANQDIREALPAYVSSAVGELSRAKVKPARGGLRSPLTPSVAYNEFNDPVDTDWAYILNWILNTFQLTNVPPHYLILDPSLLPDESLRFFYIDPVWVDCFIDGALSVANHLDQQDDNIRQSIKEHVNEYLRTPLDPSAVKQLLPQVPSSGFLLRSIIVEAMPDIQVTAPFNDPADPRSHLLRHELIDNQIMLCLMDRYFDSTNLKEITIAQPPHQQRFALGLDLTDKELRTNLRTLHNLPNIKVASDNWGPLLEDDLVWNPGVKNTEGLPDVYDWKTKLVDIEALAKIMLDKLNTLNPRGFKDTIAGAAMVGLQLNDPNWHMTMKCPAPLSSRSVNLGTTQATAVRQIYVGGQSGRSIDPQSRIQNTGAVAAFTRPKVIPMFWYHSQPQISDFGHFIDRPPHIPFHRNLPVIPNLTVNGKLDGGTTNPFYTLTVYPAEAVMTKKFDSPIPTNKGIPIDLVFNLQRTRTLPKIGPGPALLRFDISIPIRGKSTATAQVLANTYDGTGARMLNNARWIVGVQPEDPGDTGISNLVCRLVPRSSKRNVMLGKNTDCSFILNLVDIEPTTGTLEISKMEYYYIPELDVNKTAPDRPTKVTKAVV